MNSLTTETLNQLREVLGDCAPFDDPAALRALFVDGRIAHWRGQLPEGDSSAGRLTTTLDFLLQRQDKHGQNGLLLFLQVLGNNTHANDGCQPRLGRLAATLANELSPPPAARQPIENPFLATGRINNPALFFGRQQLVREMRAELGKRVSLSLVGPSEVGKSSLLYYLYATHADWLPGGQIVYLDLQGVLDEADFCETVLAAVGRSGDSLRQLKQALSGRDIILLLDEMERLAESDFNPRLHDLLRALAQEPQFALCLATRRPLIDIFPPRTAGGLSPFHNIFHLKELGPFSPNEARQMLLSRTAGSGITFSEAEIGQLLRDSQCHPAGLQRLAYRRFAERCAL